MTTETSSSTSRATDLGNSASAAGTAAASLPTAERFPVGTLLATIAGMFMVTLDFFIVNVAIPSIQHRLSAGPAQLQATVLGFGVAYAALMITGGRLGDLFGRRRMLLIGLAVFVLASLACGLAPTMSWLIGGRVLQGVGAAILSPQVLAILSVAFSPAQRAKAFVALALSIGFGATFGQLIGGALIEADPGGLGWRSVFLINLPVGVIAILIGWRSIPETRGNGRAGLDLPGTLLVTAGLVAVTVSLVAGRAAGWPEWSIILLVLSVPLLAGFVLHQRRLERGGRAPLIALSLFAERSFTVGLGVVLLFFSSMASFFLILALYLQEGRHLSPLDSGLVFAATGAGYFIASVRAPAMAARLGRQVLSLGALGVAVGFGALAGIVHAYGAGGSVWAVAAGLFVAGSGMGLVMMPVIPLVLAGVCADHAAAAGGVLATAQEGGNALGVAVIGAIFFNALAGAGSTLSSAFVTSLLVLAGIQLMLTGIVQLLPRPVS